MDSGFIRQSVGLFDHLVGADEQRGRQVETERLRSFEVDNQLVLGRSLQNRLASRPEDTIAIASGAAAPNYFQNITLE